MALFDLLGRRMALRLLWELSQAGRPMTFRELQAAAETNPSVLNARLAELRAAGVVVRDARGYGLGDEGRALLRLLLPLQEWAEAWAARLGAGRDETQQAERDRRAPGEDRLGEGR